MYPMYFHSEIILNLTEFKLNFIIVLKKWI